MGKVLRGSVILLAVAYLFPAIVSAETSGGMPRFSLSPAAGPQGASFSVIGADYPANAPISIGLSIGFERNREREARSDADGGFISPLDTGGLVPGDYPVTVDGGYPTVPILSATLTILPAGSPIPPAVAVTPERGAAGTRFTASGDYYPPKSQLTLVVVGPGGISRTLQVGTGAPGNFEATIDSTSLPPGTYVVRAEGPTVPAGQREGRFVIVDPNDGLNLDSLRCFPETGHCIQDRFLTYWRAHGELAINGYPLSDEFTARLADGKEYRVQYFERVRMEDHPENADPRYRVLLGQFGRLLHPADPPVLALGGTARYFPETGHNVPSRFAAYWRDHGGLDQFGYPLSEVIRERLGDGREYDVQYFERARFELHPQNPSPYDVLLGQFGRQILDVDR